MAKAKATPSAAPASSAPAGQELVGKAQNLIVSLETLANAAHSASYAASQYFASAHPGSNFIAPGLFSGLNNAAAAAARAVSSVPAEGEDDAEADGNPAKRRKRTKSTTPKDPNAPKKPLTAYFAFAKAARPEVVGELPKATNKEITEELASRWAAMKDTGEQQPFRDQYAIEMKSYNKTNEAYKAKAGLPASSKLPEVEEAAEPEAEEEEEPPTPAPKPVTPKSARGSKKAESATKAKKGKAAKEPVKEKGKRKSTAKDKEVTPPPSGEEEAAPAPATKSPRKRKRKD